MHTRGCNLELKGSPCKSDLFQNEISQRLLPIRCSCFSNAPPNCSYPHSLSASVYSIHHFTVVLHSITLHPTGRDRVHGLEGSRCRANVAHIRQARPDSGLGFRVKTLELFRCALFPRERRGKGGAPVGCGLTETLAIP